jgi:hypothetical protein
MPDILDIAHLSFLELIRDAIRTTGSAAAVGNLVRKAMAIASETPEASYPSLEAWEAAVKAQEHPITRVEGVAIRDGYLFSLPACPFAPSIKTYKNFFGKMPSEYPQLVAEYNKPSRITDELKVGHGAGVSPFCAVHQPLRAMIGKRIKIGDKSVRIYQLACKAGDGTRGFADVYIQELGVSKDLVNQMLDRSMCVYAVKVLDSVS